MLYFPSSRSLNIPFIYFTCGSFFFILMTFGGPFGHSWEYLWLLSILLLRWPAEFLISVKLDVFLVLELALSCLNLQHGHIYKVGFLLFKYNKIIIIWYYVFVDSDASNILKFSDSQAWCLVFYSFIILKFGWLSVFEIQGLCCLMCAITV